MFCDRCGNERAEIFLVKMLNGKKIEEHLCRECMKEVLPIDDVTNMFKVSFSLDGIMQIQDAIKELLMPVLPDLIAEENKTIKCPHCGMEISFDDLDLDSGEHSSLGTEMSDGGGSRTEELKREMAQVIKEENYERAAVIRDLLKTIEKERSNEGNNL